MEKKESEEFYKSVLENAHKIIPQFMEEYSSNIELGEDSINDYLSLVNNFKNGDDFRKSPFNFNFSYYEKIDGKDFYEIIGKINFNINDNFYTYTDLKTGEEKRKNIHNMLNLDESHPNYECCFDKFRIMLYPNNMLISKRLNQAPIEDNEISFYEDTMSDHSRYCRKYKSTLIQFTEEGDTITANYYTYDDCEYEDWKSSSVYKENFKLEKTTTFDKKSTSLKSVYQTNSVQENKVR